MSDKTRKEYIEEGQRRMKIRKDKRNNEYRRLSADAREAGRSISAMKWNSPWEDPSSPTGWSQVCDYMGNCQFPCNGDC